MRFLTAITATLCSMPVLAQDGVVGHWVFARRNVEQGRLVDLAGHHDARLTGRQRFFPGPSRGSLLFSGRNDRAVISERMPPRAQLPTQDMTIEAWVSIDRPQNWGGIVCLLQDNGGFEKGWLLGYSGSRFCFAVSSHGADDGDGKLTYLNSKTEFRLGRWYHVVGTYDGRAMRVYVNGKQESLTRTQSGPIVYPETAVWEIGSYHDSNEDYPMLGLLGELRILKHAMSGREVAARYAAAVKTYERRGPAPAATHAWTFDPKHFEARRFVPTTGRTKARAVGPATFTERPPSLVLGGRTGVEMALGMRLPRAGLTVETTVWVGNARGRGTLVGAQDAGGMTGFELGFAERRVRFRLASKDGAPGGTVVKSRDRLEPFHWYHIVATYDGALQRLIIDGKASGAERGEFGDIVYGRADRLRVGVRSRRGSTEFMRGRIKDLRVYPGAISETTARDHMSKQRRLLPRALRLAVPPSVEYLDHDSARFTWETAEAEPSSLEIIDDRGQLERYPTPTSRRHSVTVDALRPASLYDYRVSIQAGRRSTRAHELDTTFNYMRVFERPRSAPWRDGEQRETATRATRILTETGIRRGWCLLLGDAQGRLAFELARQSELDIVVASFDPQRASAIRSALADAGLYGTRISVTVVRERRLPFTDWFANLVIVAGAHPKLPRAEIERCLRPYGGKLVSADGIHERPPLEGAGEWTHQYGGGANTASSGDQLVKGPMVLQWFGRPGPRPMLDRGCRSPSPLFADGRMIVQGDRRLFSIDAYNGTILWTRELPALRRVNVPRDSSNTAIAGDRLYVAIRDRLHVFDAESGATVATLPTSNHQAWGYVGVDDSHIIGTTTHERAIYTGADGEWYDGTGRESEQVLGSSLFVLDRKNHDVLWSRARGLVVHSTITVLGGVMYFFEDRNPTPDAVARGRLKSTNGKRLFLVALEVPTGKRVWEKRLDVTDCDRVLYLSATRQTLVVLGSRDGYVAWGFDALSGKQLWNERFPWKRDHHGGTIQHPVLIGDVIYAEFRALALRTGEILRDDLPPRRGCGTMSGSARGLFYRHYSHNMLDLETNEVTKWLGVRSGCWLSILPAGGLMLAPESSSGCSCPNPIQASVVFRPVR